MGEKQIRAAAEKAARELHEPKFKALADLAVASRRAAPEELKRVLTDAKEQAQRILDNAKTEKANRVEQARVALQTARSAGWTSKELRGLNLDQPSSRPASRQRTASKSTQDEPPAADAPAEFGGAERDGSVDAG
ncbi:hypothetical protein ACIRG5_45660 [Lentzea sp. NPDC102401]|uniref:hypothetical protein n=1 Tax=Lentzea sp. NPDC102401 TaxID=3364128 RepID=UPI0037FD6409